MSRYLLPLLVALCSCSEDITDTSTFDPCPGPELLTSLDSIMEALRSGRTVRVNMDYGACLLDGEPGPAAVGGMDITAWEWFDVGSVGNDQAYVSFSKSSLILFYDVHYYDYVKVRVYADGAVQAIAEYLDPTTFEVEMYEEFECVLDQGEGGSAQVWAQ